MYGRLQGVILGWARPPIAYGYERPNRDWGSDPAETWSLFRARQAQKNGQNGLRIAKNDLLGARATPV